MDMNKASGLNSVIWSTTLRLEIVGVGVHQALLSIDTISLAQNKSKIREYLKTFERCIEEWNQEQQRAYTDVPLRVILSGNWRPVSFKNTDERGQIFIPENNDPEQMVPQMIREIINKNLSEFQRALEKILRANRLSKTVKTI